MVLRMSLVFRYFKIERFKIYGSDGEFYVKFLQETQLYLIAQIERFRVKTMPKLVMIQLIC